MEKSYQLCDAGNKVVLRRLVEPDYEMRTVLVADELVHVRDLRQRDRYEISGQPFFVLKQDELYFICWERKKCIQVVPCCKAFLLIDNNVLLKKEERWYWWPADADMTGLRPLGKQISSLGRLFIFKQNRGCLLNYFEDGRLKNKSCRSYEILNVDFQEHVEKPRELFPDILSFSDEKGVHYLSVERTSDEQKGFKGECLVSYSFEFRDEPSDELIAFAAYVKKFCDKMVADGVYIAKVQDLYSYANIRYELSQNQDFKISLNIDLKRNGIPNVSVFANLSKLYHGCNESYQVYCSELDYCQAADDVWIEKNDQEIALLVACDGKADKISCSSSVIFDERRLILSKNV